VLNKNDDNKSIIFGTGFGGISDIKEGPDGLIYIISYSEGAIYRIVPKNMVSGADT
jgi:glucose/arabinose dehydrogenase